MTADIKIDLGEWLPDLPDLDNPGLTEAQNVLYYEGSYKQFKPLDPAGLDDLSSEPLGGIVTEGYIYVGLSNSIQRAVNATTGSWTDLSIGSNDSYTTVSAWRFARYEDWVMGTNGTDIPQVQTLGSASRFANLSTASSSSTAPPANSIGKIGQFILLGWTSVAGYHVQWCAIDNPRDWPTPGSAEANSKQAGQEYLKPDWGPVTGIVGGDQFGLIFQEHGITRVTYVGGDEVFQFDELEGSRGCYFRHSIVEAGGVWFFISASGFCATDGSTVIQIGDEKTDRYFWDAYLANTPLRVFGGVDVNKKLVFWTQQTSAGDIANRIYAYNYVKGRFTHCEQNLNCLLSDGEADPSDDLTFKAFDSGHGGRLFTGTTGSAIITTGEFEASPGDYSRVLGVKAQVTGVNPVYTIALGTRNTQETVTPAYTSEVTANTRTGFSDFRSEARFHRARVTITGTFNSFSQMQARARKSGNA